MNNFDYLKNEPQFQSFADIAVAAENLINVDVKACITNSRLALETAIKWMYSIDEELVVPYQETLESLMHTEEFKTIVEDDLWKRLEFIRRVSSTVNNTTKKVTFDQAELCLENLFVFFDFLSCCYSVDYEEREFNPELLKAGSSEPIIPEYADTSLEALITENKEHRNEFTVRRSIQAKNYVPKPLNLSEFKTRKIYIDSMLIDAGWTENKDWINEYPLTGMPNPSGEGFADYVLFDDAHQILAVIEAKKTCVDVSKGRQQAILYANSLEKKFHRRPVIFLTNGFETHIVDGKYPERKCAAIYSKRDLEKWFNLQSFRESLKNVVIDKNIAGRYYQEAAIKAVCSSLDEKNRRKALLVMATGSGKTRTVIELCDVLLKKGWIKNILFLADRNSLVTQAKRNFVNLLPSLSCANMCEDKDYNANLILSTYQTMINLIDTTKDDKGKIFTCGHFDLIICDEAHRSIYNKYRDIFTYFDAPLIGLTATPKDEIDKNTYAIFDLEAGVPTYGYELAQAVKDGFLVDYMSVESSVKFLEQGIVYDELSDEDKAAYEDTFVTEDGDVLESIASSAINTWLFNEDTIKKVLDAVMTNGLKVDYGNKIGKTIIFAKNHKHAEKILEIFHKQYPHLGDEFAKVIDNQIKYSQSIIDEFSEANKLPQIAISVDMLDTGIDVPEVLNLVFFKKVMSKAKFWQMIGRGTRLCPGLIDGVDKTKFYIFDFCGNFEFFRMNPGKPTANMMALQSAIFCLEFEMAYKLQDIDYQTERLINYRKHLVEMMTEKVKELNRKNFAVRQHLKYVDLYSHIDNYTTLTYADTLEVREELAPLILPDEDDASALRFDALMYGIELAFLAGKRFTRSKSELLKKVRAISSVANIPEIQVKGDFLIEILHTDYVDRAGIEEFEHIREELRSLMKYLPHGGLIYETGFTDSILSVEWNESELDNDYLANYRAKVEYYIREHQGSGAIAKLKSNKPLSSADVDELEEVLYKNLGTKEDYEKEYGKVPLGELVRSIVGLDMSAAKEAFSVYLNDVNLDDRQIYFLNQIIEYIVHNGLMKDLSVLQESPFTDRGSVVEIFTDMSLWQGIRNVIETINRNAAA